MLGTKHSPAFQQKNDTLMEGGFASIGTRGLASHVVVWPWTLPVLGGSIELRRLAGSLFVQGCKSEGMVDDIS